jgi:ribosomal protein L31E
MDIESPIVKSLRKLIQKHKEQEQAKIDREIMEIVLKGDNK